MPGSSPLEKIYPTLLESSAQEVGELIGESLEAADTASLQGELDDVFKRPKKKFALAGFKLKDDAGDRVHLLVELDAAIELAARLIMLPADEIKASKKQAKLEGELLDAFSEIANIITGAVNTALHEAFAQKKLHFTKGQINVYSPGADELPLLAGSQTCFSGQLVTGEKKLGSFQFFFPHDLVAEPEKEAARKEAENAEENQAEAPDKKADEKQDEATDAHDVEAGPVPAEEPAVAGTDPGTADEILLQGLEAAREEMEALLGDKVSFADQHTGYRKKADLLTKTRGKQVLTRIRAFGETENQAFMLLPLKDAVYFGGVLLMMPAESITETVKQGQFEGEIADSFGEIANILVGCYSNQFQSGSAIRLKLKKDAVETLVPAQVDPEGDTPFPAGNYYVVSARIQMAEKSYGPLEMLFPVEALGLNPQPASSAAAERKDDNAGQSQKTVRGQKNDTVNDTDSGTKEKKPQRRIITVIGGDEQQLEAVEKSISEEGVELARFSIDSDFKQDLGRENPNCVFLFISRVNEQGLAKTIKVRSALKKECPLIVAGAQWTKSSVLKARKYGATDILATPAQEDIIRKKYRKYL